MQRQRSFRLALAAACAAALFVEAFDSVALSLAVPSISAEFGVSLAAANLATVAYLLTLGTTIPAAGFLTHRMGIRAVMLTGIALFTVASLACVGADALWVLVVARAVQGIGGALMITAGRLVVIEGTRPQDLLEAVAYLTWPSLLAPVLAPAVGGLLTDTVGWRWIFAPNIPIGAVLFVAVWRVFPRTASKAAPRRFDAVGFGLVATAMSAAVITLQCLALSAPVPLSAAAFSAFVAAATLAGRRLRRSTSLFDLGVFRYPSFRISNVSGAIYRLVVIALPLLLVFVFQLVYGWSATQAGGAILALFLGNLLIKPFTTGIIHALGFRGALLVAVTGGIVVIGVFAATAEMLPAAPVVALLVLSGALRSLGFSAYNTLQFVDLGRDETPSANTLSATVHQFATTLAALVAVLCTQIALWVDSLGGPGSALALSALAAGFVAPLVGALRLPRGAGRGALRVPR